MGGGRAEGGKEEEVEEEDKVKNSSWPSGTAQVRWVVVQVDMWQYQASGKAAVSIEGGTRRHFPHPSQQTHFLAAAAAAATAAAAAAAEEGGREEGSAPSGRLTERE